jgi:hypothetical protein
MQLRIWKRIYLTPLVRLNLYSRGFSISVGHRWIGWLTFGRRGIRGTLDTGVPAVYIFESQRWDQLAQKKEPKSRRKLTTNLHAQEKN